MPRFATTETIPDHLQPFIAKQYPELYTPIDHASWRFILRVSRQFFSGNAHQKYLDGLKETGISTEKIPSVEDMDQCLRRFGWRAVAVSGFIPPAAFMEFQSLGILPIACEMRTLDHLAYTPAPDIVHEAAGHAPIIADQEFADYLRSYGEVSRKAIFSKGDMAIYEAIRDLSNIKESPTSTAEEIQVCQRRLDEAITASTYVSEATYLARMNWWTVEYGLVGTLHHPKIYGAGLLSSMGESYRCLTDQVLKIPLTLDCLNTSYDITRPQPQLFVTRDFGVLTQILEEFGATMAFKKGGVEALAKGKISEALTTTQLDSGLQISGVLADFICDAEGLPCFLKYLGPCQLAHQDRELPQQGPAHHLQGFSSPIGKLAGLGKSPSGLTDDEQNHLGLVPGRRAKLQYQSGFEVEGKFTGKTIQNGKVVILTFEDCTMIRGKNVFYRPEWGTFDLACGALVASVYGGAADRGQYLTGTGGFQQTPRAPKTNLTDANRALNGLYAQTRKLRETGTTATVASELEQIHAVLEQKHPDDWLLRVELLEIAQRLGIQGDWDPAIRGRLKQIAATATDKADMIERGLALL